MCVCFVCAAWIDRTSTDVRLYRGTWVICGRITNETCNTLQCIHFDRRTARPYMWMWVCMPGSMTYINHDLYNIYVPILIGIGSTKDHSHENWPDLVTWRSADAGERKQCSTLPWSSNALSDACIHLWIRKLVGFAVCISDLEMVSTVSFFLWFYPTFTKSWTGIELMFFIWSVKNIQNRIFQGS